MKVGIKMKKERCVYVCVWGCVCMLVCVVVL